MLDPSTDGPQARDQGKERHGVPVPLKWSVLMKIQHLYAMKINHSSYSLG